MSKISEFDAAKQMGLLNMLGDMDQAMEEVRGYGTDGNEDSADHEMHSRPIRSKCTQ